MELEEAVVVAAGGAGAFFVFGGGVGFGDGEAFAVEGQAEGEAVGGDAFFEEVADGEFEGAWCAGLFFGGEEGGVVAGVIGPFAGHVVGHDVDPIEVFEKGIVGEPFEGGDAGGGGHGEKHFAIFPGADGVEFFAEVGADAVEAFDFFGVVGVFPIEVEAVVVVGVGEFEDGAEVALFGFGIGGDGGELFVPAPATEGDEDFDVVLMCVGDEGAAGNVGVGANDAVFVGGDEGLAEVGVEFEIDFGGVAENVADEDFFGVIEVRFCVLSAGWVGEEK